MNHNALFAAPDGGNKNRPYVFAQLGQSLDGRIATPTGASKYINGPAALEHLHRLRSQVDAVMVGIGTVIADDPLLNVRNVAGKNPDRIIIDPNGKLWPEAKCLKGDDGQRVFVIGNSNSTLPENITFLNMTARENGLDPVEILKILFEQGIKRLLIEGGAHTIGRFLDARLVDRLHLLIAPMILGSGKTGLELSPIDQLSEALRPKTSFYPLEDGNILVDCDFTNGKARL